jgi:hypothetical protein
MNGMKNVGVGTQIDPTHCVLNESLVTNNDGEKAISQKIQFLHTILEECLNTEQVHSLAHLHGAIYDTYTVYHELKQHALAGNSYLMVPCHNTLRQFKVQESGVVHFSMWHYICMSKSSSICGSN